MRRILRTGLTAALVGLVVVLAAGSVAADDSPRCRFTGTATAGGSEVAGGTRITAIIDGDEYHTHTPTGGSSYNLTIRAPEGKSYAEGTRVVFEIDGYQTGETATFQAGGNVRLDLTTAVAAAGHSTAADARARAYSGQTEGGASFGWPMVVGLCGGLLATAALAYYFVVLSRVLRRARADT